MIRSRLPGRPLGIGLLTLLLGGLLGYNLPLPPLDAQTQGPQFVEWKAASVFVGIDGKLQNGYVGKILHRPTGSCWLVFGSTAPQPAPSKAFCSDAPR